MAISKIAAFCRHWLTSQTRYAVHSPFVYEWVTQVLPHRITDKGKEIESLRKAKLNDRETSFQIRDFGAGYGGQAEPVIHKSMAEVVRSSARGLREGELLSRLARFQKAQAVLELGGNLGFSTAYLAAGMPSGGELVSIEGADTLAQHAQQMLSRLDMDADIRVGEFEEVLSGMTWASFRPDLVLLDGNHTYEATLRYFDFLLPHLAPGACVVVDDINWSKGMRKAWEDISEKPECSVSIDLFSMGILYIRREQRKEAFQFRFNPL